MADKKTVTVDDSVAAAMDTNGDGHISAEEMQMDLEFKRKRLEDEDLMRDAQRNMAWFALFGMLLYPFAVVASVFAGLDQAVNSTRINGSYLLCISCSNCSSVLC